MRRLFLTVSAVAVLAAAPLAISPPGPGYSGIVAMSTAEAQTRVSFNLFFSSLERHGKWVRSPSYNYIWVPTRVDRNWAPYAHGHWVHTDRYGWYWVSDEPFAWVVYHYGRWGYDRKIGWFWVPGTKWGPAWVAWRRGDRHVGWAPLPPPGRGYVVDVSINININVIPTYRWHFVRSDRFLDRQLAGVVIRGDRDRDVFERSRPLGPVVIQNNVIVNNVIDVDFIERETKKEVQTVEVKEVANPEQAAQESEGGAVAAVVEDVALPAENEQPTEVADQQEIEQAPPPTSGIEAAAAAGEEGAAATAESEECVDTDPNAEGCQPASGQAEGPAATEQGEQGAAEAPAEGQQGEQGAAEAPSEEQTDQGAAQAPSDEQTDEDAAQAPADDAAPANESSADQQACPEDTDPQQAGCQMPGQASDQSQPPASTEQGATEQEQGSGEAAEAPAETPAQTEQGAAEQGEGGDAAGLPSEEDVESGAGGSSAERQGQENCEQDADPQQPGCQPPAQQ